MFQSSLKIQWAFAYWTVSITLFTVTKQISSSKWMYSSFWIPCFYMKWMSLDLLFFSFDRQIDEKRNERMLQKKRSNCLSSSHHSSQNAWFINPSSVIYFIHLKCSCPSVCMFSSLCSSHSTDTVRFWFSSQSKCIKTTLDQYINQIEANAPLTTA